MRTAEFRLCFFKQEEAEEVEEEQAVAPYRSCSLRRVVVAAVVEYRISHIPDIANAFIADSQRQLADKIATADNKRGRAGDGTAGDNKSSVLDRARGEDEGKNVEGFSLT